jgi:hypothetical protein
MKTADFTRLCCHVLPALPGFLMKGRMLFVSPLSHTLRAVLFERSLDPRAFCVQVFIQPLSVPTRHIAPSAGWRLGGGCHTWNADSPTLDSLLKRALAQDALPFLSKILTPIDAAEAAISMRKSGDPFVQQAIAYSLARGGDVERANRELATLIDRLNARDHPYPWQREMIERAEVLVGELRDDPTGAQKRLRAWEAATAKALGLEEFRRVTRV